MLMVVFVSCVVDCGAGRVVDVCVGGDVGEDVAIYVTYGIACIVGVYLVSIMYAGVGGDSGYVVPNVDVVVIIMSRVDRDVVVGVDRDGVASMYDEYC